MFIEIEGNIFAGLRIAANAMLGAVERHQGDAGLGAETVDDAIEMTVHTGWVGNQSDALSADEIGVFFEQNFNAEFHRRTCGSVFLREHRRAAGQEHGDCTKWARVHLSCRQLDWMNCSKVR